MKKGIVMEVNDEYVTMLTPDGEFLKAKNTKSTYNIGEEVDFFPLQEGISRQSRKRTIPFMSRKMILATSLTVILFLSFIIPFNTSNEVYAYMSIDINPSFEVALDEDLKVIGIDALNDEAKSLLETFPDWKDKTLDEVTETIIQKSKESGYLSNENQVVITTVVNNSHVADVDKKLETNIKKIIEECEEEEIAVTSVNSTVETREKAKEAGISTGKLLLKENKIPRPKAKERVKENINKDIQQPASEKKIDKIDDKTKIKKELKEIKKEIKKQKADVKDDLKEKAKETIDKAKEEAKKVKEEAKKEKKKAKDVKIDEVKEKVKENIENSNMPEEVKEKIYKKIDNIETDYDFNVDD